MKYLLSFIIILSLLTPIKAPAQSLLGNIVEHYETVEGTVIGEDAIPNSPVNIIINIIKIALGFLGIIFVIFIIISGFQWMTAGGNSDIINKAKQRMINAVIGLVIVLGVFVITDFILHSAIDAIK